VVFLGKKTPKVKQSSKGKGSSRHGKVGKNEKGRYFGAGNLILLGTLGLIK